MTSPKQLKYWRKSVKIIYWNLFGFYLQFYCIIKILHVFKILFWVVEIRCENFSASARFANPCISESVRRDHAGLHSFLSMILIEARRRNASAFRLRFSQSLARRLHRPSHANVRSTTHRFGRTTNPFA